jgi:hypothetical protein
MLVILIAQVERSNCPFSAFQVRGGQGGNFYLPAVRDLRGSKGSRLKDKGESKRTVTLTFLPFDRLRVLDLNLFPGHPIGVTRYTKRDLSGLLPVKHR